jgi:hypothetical protein
MFVWLRGQILESSVNKESHKENGLLIQRQYYEVILFEVQVQVHHEHLYQRLCILFLWFEYRLPPKSVFHINPSVPWSLITGCIRSFNGSHHAFGQAFVQEVWRGSGNDLKKTFFFVTDDKYCKNFLRS